MNEELSVLLMAIGFGLVGGIVFVTPVIIWRAIRGQPIFPKGKKLDSPKIFYIGIALFGGFAIMSFITGSLFFGPFFLLILLAYVWGLIAFKRGWRG